ncbi:MAG: hypothetical protein P1Q69_15440 [Candidatus Thorarchaeota archaeon]|nr:hypothetical protein [Candidatus Thorarchaeota archaeon]
MKEMDYSKQTGLSKIMPWQLALAFLLVSLLAPFQFIITPSENLIQIVSPVFVYFPLWNSIQIFDASYIIDSLPFTILRFVFAFQIGRYYKKATSRPKVVAFGVLGEIPSLLITILYLLQPILSAYPLVIGIPLPIALIIGIYLIKRHPQPKQPLTWKGEKKILDWWPEIDDPPK